MINLSYSVIFLRTMLLVLMESTHAVVEFTKEKSVAVVPTCWLTADNCSYWPTYTAQWSVDKAVKDCVVPEKMWPKHPIRILLLSRKCNFILVQYKGKL